MLSDINLDPASRLADVLPPTVAALDLTTIKRKLLDRSVANALSEDDLDFAESEYRRLLALRVWHPEADLVPSELVDQIWHAHILHTKAYMRDCHAMFGEYLHHDPAISGGPSGSRHELEDAYQHTKALYEMHFGPYTVDEMRAARCRGKPCHAPTPCRCRSAEEARHGAQACTFLDSAGA